VTELRLPPSADSVPVARRFTRDQLRDSECDVDTAVLLVSELVTNAVLHARSEIVLTVQDLGDTVRVDVADSSPLPPRTHNFAVESATGRGMRMLGQLAHRWGLEPSAVGLGKVIWFEVGEPSETAWESYADVLLAEGASGEL
jgi:anti-sigma regulatory factor (Ser/Thr protein kinase)